MDPLGKIAAANAFKLSLQIMADYRVGGVDGELAGGCLAALMTFQKIVICGKVEPDEGFVFHPRPTTQHFSISFLIRMIYGQLDRYKGCSKGLT